MAPNFTEDEVDDLLYYARTGDKEDFDTLAEQLCGREKIGALELLQAARDEHSGNGVLHMAAANGHESMYSGNHLSIPFPRGKQEEYSGPMGLALQTY